ncbi:uncharacterized protein PFB0765w-like [Belonocnema kinseyi]|uniref:uncharacterized protein PFB0765w-like n=1 Tax=Belonocnema kinseyi TaxID=2817044 RepID=UPI00143D1FD4|nr:uncharacterized protein PFB0765w-like [Belonocnema kinseyi]
MSIEKKTRLAESMQRATHCLQDYSKIMLEKLELTKNRLDEDSLKRLRNIEEAEKLREKYQKKWEEYEAQFEACPLAKERKRAKQELQKVEIQLEMVKKNIQVLQSNVRKYEKIKEMQLQKDIIKIAEMWLKHRNNVENVKKLRKEAAEYKNLIAEQEKKIEILIKEKETEERQNAIARFQMPPPPVMDQTLMETIMSQYSQPSPRPSPKVEPKLRLSHSYSSTFKNKELIDDFDSASMLSSLSELYTENLNPENVQEIEEVHNDEDSVSLSSNQDIEFATESNQPNIMMRSGEMSPRKILRSPAKSVAGPSQISARKTQIEKSVFEKSESSKRPANSVQEGKIRKKPHEEHPKAIVNLKEESPQRKSKREKFRNRVLPYCQKWQLPD